MAASKEELSSKASWCWMVAIAYCTHVYVLARLEATLVATSLWLLNSLQMSTAG